MDNTIQRWNNPATLAADLASQPGGIPTDWRIEISTMAQVRAVAAFFGITVKASWRRRELLDAVKAGLAPLRAQAQATPAPEPTPRTPQEAQAAQGLQALRQARADRAARLRPADRALLICEALQAVQALSQARPTLPGEALPPAPPAWGGPGPELPGLPPAARPAWMLAPWAGRPPVPLKVWPLYPQA